MNPHIPFGRESEDSMQVYTGSALTEWLQHNVSEQMLMLAAIGARKRAYAPYSEFRVGAALVTISDAEVSYVGCNIENAAHTGTHAEAAAIADMILRFPSDQTPAPIAQIVVALQADETQHALPCGDCRQRIREFGDDRTKIYGVKLNATGKIVAVEVTTLGELLPFSFGPNNLKR